MKAFGIETHAAREGQSFGEREAVETEDQIDRELGAAAVACATDVEAVAGRSASRMSFTSVGGLGSPPIRPTPSPCRTCSLVARDRRFEKADAPRRDLGLERGDAVRIAGATCAEHDLASACAAGHERISRHVLDLIGAEHREDHAVALSRPPRASRFCRPSSRAARPSPDRCRSPARKSPQAISRPASTSPSNRCPQARWAHFPSLQMRPSPDSGCHVNPIAGD